MPLIDTGGEQKPIGGLQSERPSQSACDREGLGEACPEFYGWIVNCRPLLLAKPRSPATSRVNTCMLTVAPAVPAGTSAVIESVPLPGPEAPTGTANESGNRVVKFRVQLVMGPIGRALWPVPMSHTERLPPRHFGNGR